MGVTTDPNTGAEKDEWGCSVAWLPIVMMENTQTTHAVGGAIESFRNEMVKSNDATAELLIKNQHLLR